MDAATMAVSWIAGLTFLYVCYRFAVWIETREHPEQARTAALEAVLDESDAYYDRLQAEGRI